jgi:hypothetical protein
MEQQGKEKNSTVAISPDVAKKLDIFCRDKGITKKDFISLSLHYFDRFGINPAEHESPTAELEKIRKRLDQVIAFIRTQEKEKLNPMFEAITTTEARIKTDLDTITKKENLQALIDTLNKVFGGMVENTKTDREKNKNRAEQQTAQSKKIADGLVLLAECLEGGKDRKGLTGAMRNLLGI